MEEPLNSGVLEQRTHDKAKLQNVRRTGRKIIDLLSSWREEKPAMSEDTAQRRSKPIVTLNAEGLNSVAVRQN